MSRWSLALLVTLAAPAFAQAPEPTAEPATEPAPAAPSAPVPETQAPPPAPAAENPVVENKTPPAAPAPEPKAAAPEPKAAAPAPKPAPPPPAPGPKATPPAAAEAKPGPAVPAAPPPAAPAPQVAAPTPARGDENLDAEGLRRKEVKKEARFIFENLLAGDARRASLELLYPFQLEDKRYATPEELVAAWVKQLRARRTDLVTLYDIEVLSLAEMEKKYGKPPARLGLGTLKEPDFYVAVGNLSGHAAILLFRAPLSGPPKAFAYTD